MVKGISRQVIVVQSPDPKLFEQAIFILKDGAVGKGISQDDLMKEARQAIRTPARGRFRYSGPIWACGGAAVTAAVWLLTAVL